MQKKNSKFTEKDREEIIKKLEVMTDEDIDYSDIPAITNFENWEKFYKPKKKSVNIRLDVDVLEWLKKHKNYNSLINRLCRINMTNELTKT